MNYYFENKGFSVINVIIYFNIIDCQAQKRSDDKKLKDIFAEIDFTELIKASWVISICILVFVCLGGLALKIKNFHHCCTKRRPNEAGEASTENANRIGAEESVIPR